MNRLLAIEFLRVTEAAAVATYSSIGKGDKNLSDQLAVNAMRKQLNRMNIDGEIVIGEGELDEAPMLYIGEKVGLKSEFAALCDIAVDPIDGTSMSAKAQQNAVSVIVVTDKAKLLKAPDMYMEKLVVNEKAAGSIDLNLTFEENFLNVAKKLNKLPEEMVMATLWRERHMHAIEICQKYNAKVIALTDGDVATAIHVALPYVEVDLMYAIGGAPEGVIAAAVAKALGGDMQARLMHYAEVWPNNVESQEITLQEQKTLNKLGLDTKMILPINKLCSTDDVIVSITGITDGDLVKGVIKKGDYFETESLLIRGRSGTLRYVRAIHDLNKKEEMI